MGWVSPEEIEAAKQVDILDYLQRHERDNLKSIGTGTYCLRDHDSFVISNGKWNWFSRGFGCKTGTALNYLIRVRGYEFTEAVRTLLNDSPHLYPPSRPKAASPTAERRPFKLPSRNNKDARRAIAYLQSRGIDKALILDCISQGLIFEDAKFHNVVFTGKNENGKTRFACVRSTTGIFKGDVDGSDKRYGFLLPPSDPDSRNIACFEAPIDALSHKTVCMKGLEDWDGWRLTLSGGSMLALKHFLQHHPAVDNVFICADLDDAGDMTAERIWALKTDKDSPFKHIVVKPYPPTTGNDWNDALQTLLKTERSQDRPAATKNVR